MKEGRDASPDLWTAVERRAAYEHSEWGKTIMTKSKLDGAVLDGVHATSTTEPHDPIDDAQLDQTDIVVTAATVVVVGAGVALFEAALLPGVVLGVAAMLVPKVLPSMGAALNPMFKSTVRGAYKFGQKTKEMVAEAQEHVNDIVAEAKAADDTPLEANGKAAATPAH
jgi:hypothetical protein